MAPGLWRPGGGVLKFELGTDARPKVSTTTGEPEQTQTYVYYFLEGPFFKNQTSSTFYLMYYWNA